MARGYNSTVSVVRPGTLGQTTIAQNLPCLVQPIPVDEEINNDGPSMKAMMTCALTPDITFNDIVTWGGYLWTVRNALNTDGRGAQQNIIIERVRQ